MIELCPHKALYAAFDRFPSEKGASTHIQHFAGTLFEHFQGGLLYVLGDEALPVFQQEGDVQVLRFSQTHANFLHRTQAYGAYLQDVLMHGHASLALCHVRDPWGAVPLLAFKQRRYKLLYEVNGLPSIELPYAFPYIAPRTLEKIRALEDYALAGADAIVVPSQVIATHLIGRDVPEAKIEVIPNGAEPGVEVPRPAGMPARYILYFGALQPWQGVDTLMRAFARLADIEDLHLVICSSVKPRHAKRYHKLAVHLGIGERVIWRYRLSESELAPWRAHALASAAPLTECSRNLDQGCSPLKILESMAAAVPVIASDLPVVRELIEDEVHGLLVRAERPAAIARAVRLLIEYPEMRRAMGEAGREKIRHELSWSRARADLRAVYTRLCADLDMSGVTTVREVNHG